MNKHCDICAFNNEGFCEFHVRFTAWMFSNYCDQFKERGTDNQMQVEIVEVE